ncbi:response regulator transcription factor [Streptomyces sp. NBC_00249]|uniref:response regulator transcription factor n=1 Tax=Streptomyces sp. NBC_00249 TaxID=2975690 RepID=UPI0022581DF6|nr:response regulator transcription factor [Streptomyces sp. NBC_00249]MCX5199469.1 response regulator transcription factor [Streptomyces sp. NBC_00249]
MTDARPISVFVADENTIFREGLRTIVNRDEGLSVVGHGPTTEGGLLENIVDAQPDVILLGLDQVTADHVETLVAGVVRAAPHADTIVLASSVQAGVLQQMMGIGVRAYLPKDVPHRYLLSAVYMSRFDVSGHGNSRMGFLLPRPDKAHGPPAGVLSTREREVVELVGKAMTNAQIGRQLSISEGTVKRHLHNIFVKLQAVSRLDAVNKAVALCLIMVN